VVLRSAIVITVFCNVTYSGVAIDGRAATTLIF